jgi:hypothetical protein
MPAVLIHRLEKPANIIITVLNSRALPSEMDSVDLHFNVHWNAPVVPDKNTVYYATRIGEDFPRFVAKILPNDENAIKEIQVWYF